MKKHLFPAYFRALFFLTILPAFSLYASEPYQNIMGFYGERAAGLGGAFTAISDDPSGAFYNPAGLAFSMHDGFSISASNYKQVTKTYKNIDSPGQEYTQKYSGYDPNFVGLLKTFDGWKFGFSVVNTYNLQYERADQVNFPLNSPTINSTRNYSRDKASQILVGPSAAILLTPKLSIGGTLYYLHDTRNLSRSQFQQFSDFSFVNKTFIDNRQTSGLLPILGIQYQASQKLSLGASLRHIFVTGGNRLYNEVYTDSSRGNGQNSVDFIEGTTSRGFTSVENGVQTVRPKLNSRIPETTEMRVGFAYFPTSRLMTSFDTIYTSGFKRAGDQTSLRFQGTRNNLVFTENDIRELTRVSTLNFALGVEYYLADTFAVLLGGYTNEPNSKPISWTESAFDLSLQNAIGNEIRSSSGNSTLTYGIERSGTNPRNEHSRNRGLSFGISWVTSKSSLSLTYIREVGYGNSRIDSNALAQSFEYQAQSLYIMVSSRN